MTFHKVISPYQSEGLYPQNEGSVRNDSRLDLLPFLTLHSD